MNTLPTVSPGRAAQQRRLVEERARTRAHATAVACIVLVAMPAGTVDAGDDPVTVWVERRAVEVSLDITASNDDLAPLRDVVRNATVVGLGESTHGSHEQCHLKHRIVRFLVERIGFRTVAFEDDFASGVVIDHYLVTGDGDPIVLAAAMSSPFWATAEIVEL